METSIVVAPDSRQASRRSANRSFGPTSATSSTNASGTSAAASRLSPVQVRVLDRLGLRLVPVPPHEVVVEVLPARAHAADVERVVGLQELASRLGVVDEDRRRARRDVEVGPCPGDGLRERRARLLRRPEDREPAVPDLGRLRDRLRGDRGDVDRDLGAQRPCHQLERLAEAGAVRQRDVVVLAVVLEQVAPEGCPHDLDVLARLRERLPPRLPVPALDDLRARRAEPEQEATAGEEVERRGRHRGVGRRAAGDLHDPGPELDLRGRRPEPREHAHAVRSPGLGRPGRVVAEPLRLLGERDRLERARPRRRVSHVEPELHRCAMLTPWPSPNCARPTTCSSFGRAYRAFMEAHVYPNESALGREDDESDALTTRLRELAKERGAVGPAPSAGGGRVERELPRLRAPERGDRALGVGAARLRLPGTGRGERRDPLALRNGRAEGALAQASRRRRGALVLLDDRARGSGLRSDHPPHPCRAGRRRVGHRRAQVVLVGSRGSRLRDRHGRHRPRCRAASPRHTDRRAGRHAGLRDRAGRPDDGSSRPRVDDALRGSIHGRTRPRREHARRGRRRLPDRAEAARPRPHPPRHALARPDAARIRAHVLVRARAGDRSAARSPRSRRSRTGSPTRPPRSRPAGS